MKGMVLVTLLTGCLAGNVNGWLDATEEQCAKRYGKPEPAQTATLGSDKTITYRKEGVYITADFIKGKCLRIKYVPSERLTRDQIDTFFNANGGTSAWSHPKGGSGDEYVRRDGLAKAIVDTIWGSVTFVCNQWEKVHEQAVKDFEAAKQAAEKKRIEKFKRDF